ncbi:MAG: hypothetical protein ACXVY5_07165, partial [Gaiellales bacterium]
AHGADPTSHGAERNSWRSWLRCQTADSSWALNTPARSHRSIEREISPAMYSVAFRTVIIGALSSFHDSTSATCHP